MSKAWQFIGQQGAQQADERSERRPPLPENRSLGSLITTIALAASQSWHAEKKSGWRKSSGSGLAVLAESRAALLFGWLTAHRGHPSAPNYQCGFCVQGLQEVSS
ncbi:hypothetical protein Q7C36_021468 [Tachysurus vachellii]|uniref:Uncharacterized protein n=1 Tax=Tachysurus vachellii TaxID=175792 RepID=A0AA88J5K9_TACVA|nr:hypothetical protein Q7C36_021468 [Tachysurus vachellii]